MPRRPYKKKPIRKDELYDSWETSKLIHYIMRDGKKTVAERLVYTVFDALKKSGLDPIEVLHKAINNVAPLFEVRPKRVGGASYLVPTETRADKKIFLALNWIIAAAESRSSKEYRTFDRKLLAELTAAYQGEGEAVDKRRRVEKLAEANKAFAHFRW